MISTSMRNATGFALGVAPTRVKGVPFFTEHLNLDITMVFSNIILMSCWLTAMGKRLIGMHRMMMVILP